MIELLFVASINLSQVSRHDEQQQTPHPNNNPLWNIGTD